MVQWLVRRLLLSAVLVVTVSSSALLFTRMAPGDVTTQLGPFAKPDELAAVRARFDLDRPALVQWGLWLGRAVRLDLGTSFLYNRPVSEMIGRAAMNSAILAAAALLVTTFLGIPLGIFTGHRTGLVTSIIKAAACCVCRCHPC